MQIVLTGKRALVTGANSGIGEAIALALGEAGTKVGVNYVTHPEAAKAVVDKIESAGGEAVALQADVSNPTEVAQLFEQLDAHWGGLDILVNNAGIDGPHALAWEPTRTRGKRC